jgi:F-type H+-transporting ATPase subunit b
VTNLFNIVLAAADGVTPGRLFGLDMQTLIQVGIHFFNVGLLAFILAKLLYKPIREMMAKRSERIRGQLDHAADEMVKAQELKALYEQKLREIEKQSDGIIDEARKKATETKNQILAEAKAEAETAKSRAQATIEMEWERAEEQMKLAILEVSAVMAGKMVSVAMNKETHEKLFDETMAELEGTSWRN